MRILQTGMTAQQAGSTRSPLGLVSAPRLFNQALTDLGHEVEFRQPTPDDDVTAYDCVIVGLTGITAMGAQHTYTALRLINNCEASNTPLILLLDDWKITDVPYGFARITNNPHLLTKPLMKDCRRHYDWATSDGVTDRLLAVLWRLREHEWPWPVLLPVFPWGNHERFHDLLKQARWITPMDPSAYAPRYERLTDEPKQRKWVSAALTTDTNWVLKQGLTWPLEIVGRKRKGQLQLKEPELVGQKYAESWGVVSTPYTHAGSGWWRTRFQFAADMGCVLLTDPRETPGLGFYGLPATEIEGRTDAELAALAGLQADELRSHAWSKGRLQSALSDLLCRVGAVRSTV